MSDALSPLEAEFVRHVEVLGLPVSRAGALLGITTPDIVARKPHIQAAREEAKRGMAQRARITKEDVIQGMKDAVEQAVTLADPMSQIRGWSEIGKLLDFYTPTKVNIYLAGQANQIRRELAEMDDQKLLELIPDDEKDVIDADFYQADHNGGS